MILRGLKQVSARSALLCLIIGGTGIVSATDYELDGVLEQTIYNRDGSVATFHKSQFTVFVRDCAWLIRTTQNDTNGKPVVASETACVNGAEIYQVSGRMDAGSATAGRGSRSLNQALIVSNNVPIGRSDGYFVCHIWQMFASGCYFQNRTNSWLAPVYDLNASADVMPYLKLKAKWELIDGPGSLPKSVAYYRDDNSIDATYTATGATNAGTVKIPSGFVFEWRNLTQGRVYPYSRTVTNQPASTNNLRKRTMGTVTAVRPYCSRKDLTPTAKGKTLVTDQRPLQELWSPSLPTNIPEWLFQVGLWNGNTNQAASLPKNIPAYLFRMHSSEPPTNRTYYVVQDGVQWLPLAKAKKAYMVPHAPVKPVSRVIVAAILLLPTGLFLTYLLLNRKKD